ncbi:hypothetical protein Tcan_03877 [Toxocara canis]|uniref:Uncharacterized protein n=1 Tax=Toxocara canis TaxID=6265 RepID=A0A0B2UX19_TOXCA|nr:hypothetical protein Tcan_03877 [Toxocara canis]
MTPSKKPPGLYAHDSAAGKRVFDLETSEHRRLKLDLVLFFKAQQRKVKHAKEYWRCNRMHEDEFCCLPMTNSSATPMKNAASCIDTHPRQQPCGRNADRVTISNFLNDFSRSSSSSFRSREKTRI